MKEESFLIIGSFGGSNLGDDAVLDTIIQQIKKKYKKYTIYIPTANTAYLKKSYGDNINVVPININIRTGAIRFTSLQTIISLFKVNKIITTAGILFDYDAHKFLFKNFVTTLIPLFTIAKVLNKEIVGLNVGVVQKSVIWKGLLKNILNKHDILYLREPDDEAVLSKLNVVSKRVNAADIVFLNEANKKEYTIQENRKPIIGVNLNKYIDIQADSKQKVEYETFIKTIALNLDKIVNENSSRIKFLSTSTMDYSVQNAVKDLMENSESVDIPEVHSYQELIYETSKVDILIGMRMHSLIFATLVEKPVCSMNYNPKVTNYMKQLEMEHHSHEIIDLNEKTLYDSVNEILNNYNHYQEMQKYNLKKLKTKAAQSLNSL